jgi:hypothetical protein
MRIHHVLTLIGAAALSLSAAAAPASGDVTTSTSVASVQITADSGYKLRASEFNGVQGNYDLADGTTLRVIGDHRKLYAEVNGERKEIVAKSAHVFASRDDAIRLVFEDNITSYDVKLSKLAL